MQWTNPLVKRLVTAAILLPVVLLGILYLPSLSFLLISGAFFLIASLEWPKLMGKDSYFNRLLYLTVLLILMFVSWVFFQSYAKLSLVNSVLYILILLWWCVAFAWVLFYNRHTKSLHFNVFIYAFIGFLVLIPCWLGMNVMRDLNKGSHFLLFYLVLIWSADTAAYFGGRQWGSKKLMPNGSPNKTREGVYTALVVTLILATVGSFLLPLTNSQRVGLIIIAMITVIFSILGDLFISVLKRQQGLKDSGNMLPGHGGLLDRIDSLTSSAPIFAIGLLLIGLH